MNLHVGCTLVYDVLTPTANFTFNILANRDPHQHLSDESIRVAPSFPLERTSTSKGNRVFRVEAAAGPFAVAYRAVVEVSRPPAPAEVKADNPGRLPLTTLTYILPSRYCESDRFTQIAWDLFGKIANRAEQVREICRWIAAGLAYTPGATDSRTSAWDVWQLRKGVCRDYAHLAIALCRALSIPARYVGGYAAGLEPMDFHACFEAYLGGQWYLFDPTDNIAPDHVVVIARGRDAANAALTTIFGRVNAGAVKVECVVAPADVASPVDLSDSEQLPSPA
ncbi:MAG: transglutaminase family protein [Verrucomicrobia bacterium]|nr:transglutaminase family protein [Verrucomicrobiota bacterium]